MFFDPLSQSNDRRDAGDSEGAYKILMDLCQADLRCLDAHSHLGNLIFKQAPKDAIRHYEVGVRIGELSLGEGFAGLLPWWCRRRTPRRKPRSTGDLDWSPPRAGLSRVGYE